MMRIINLIDNIKPVNFGIWNAALSTATILKEKYNIRSEAWFPTIEKIPHIPDVEMVPLNGTQTNVVSWMIQKRNPDPANTLIISHGCWNYPTLWGYKFQQAGFKWIYTPHGMLEPWSMSQKKWKKKIYFALREGPLSKKADKIRAVGKPELGNLKTIYPAPQITLIPNGIETEGISFQTEKWKTVGLNYLFMARLHHKKAIIPLVRAWLNSPQANDTKAKLNIAGPDDGELQQLQSLIKNNPGKNIHYLGAVYGKEKEKLLRESHVYLLPSHSEGFPTSVLEAMAYGLIPVISPGCNFPEAFEAQTAIQVLPHEEAIGQSLAYIYSLSRPELQKLALKASDWIKANYNLERIADSQAKLFQQLLGNDQLSVIN